MKISIHIFLIKCIVFYFLLNEIIFLIWNTHIDHKMKIFRLILTLPLIFRFVPETKKKKKDIHLLSYILICNVSFSYKDGLLQAHSKNILKWLSHLSRGHFFNSNVYFYTTKWLIFCFKYLWLPLLLFRIIINLPGRGVGIVDSIDFDRKINLKF